MPRCGNVGAGALSEWFQMVTVSMKSPHNLHVTFLKQLISAELQRKLSSMKSPRDKIGQGVGDLCLRGDREREPPLVWAWFGVASNSTKTLAAMNAPPHSPSRTASPFGRPFGVRLFVSGLI